MSNLTTLKGHKMNAITLAEFKNINDNESYKHLGLFKSNGDSIVRFNSNSVTPQSRLEMIEKRLSSPMMTEQVYLIKGKFNTQKDSITDDYYIINPQKENQTMSENFEIQQPEVNGNKVYSLKEGIDINTKLIKCELENVYLKEKIEKLEENIKLLESEIDELENETLSEDKPLENSITSWLSEMSKIAVPIMDKYFDLQERKLNQTTLAEAPEPLESNINTDSVNLLDERVKAFIINQEPETSETLRTYYNTAVQSGNFDTFFTMTESYNSELYNNLNNYLNS
ncbi:MAG: hypothetical protein CBD16_09065 [Betaproteobacteria bacterium TMED156]|nr:MAG: hypothetical protein CBD16_09065 [Betaproteobacteria bacterium TMED156]